MDYSTDSLTSVDNTSAWLIYYAAAQLSAFRFSNLTQTDNLNVSVVLQFIFLPLLLVLWLTFFFSFEFVQMDPFLVRLDYFTLDLTFETDSYSI